ncbi:Crp/Fnr family transcriptional regulator [Hymenobacter cellulosilyticus]|uniref:Crp/Fnr family transcriptional regulator n=1 Tax=Hymenobacter cellulosilyticus TaxID=2932248 RepID=A0A8T9Q5K5_9BACT|nr:Crp/Fnr family transcriptional regulator [Hymenobacter cellulosilyticus]UOQ70383.1 Crp/Fnr family transcriptional regulator [Hymenobacter cellulosilyticus]
MAPVSPVSPHQLLTQQLQAFARLSEEDLRLAEEHWTLRTIPRHEFFNFRNAVCQYVGFIVRGLFRVYYVDPVTDTEHNVVFVPEGTFLTSLKSLLTQEACPYYIAALEDAELLVISVGQLQALFDQSHGWERFGRLLAEQYLVVQQAKAEAMLFQTAEQRYLALLEQFPGVTNRVSLGHIASYLGIKGPSLSRIRAQLGRV